MHGNNLHHRDARRAVLHDRDYTTGDRGNDKADEAATIGMKNGTRLREAHVAQSLQQAAEAETRKRREVADLGLAGEDLPEHHAHLK